MHHQMRTHRRTDHVPVPTAASQVVDFALLNALYIIQFPWPKFSKMLEKCKHPSIGSQVVQEKIQIDTWFARSGEAGYVIENAYDCLCCMLYWYLRR